MGVCHRMVRNGHLALEGLDVLHAACAGGDTGRRDTAWPRGCIEHALEGIGDGRLGMEGRGWRVGDGR
eukprot:915545-Pelagomonas_calceolata.AAC.2